MEVNPQEYCDESQPGPPGYEKCVAKEVELPADTVESCMSSPLALAALADWDEEDYD